MIKQAPCLGVLVYLLKFDDALRGVLQTLLTLHNAFQFFLLHVRLSFRCLWFYCLVSLRFWFFFRIGVDEVIGKSALFWYQWGLRVREFASEEDLCTLIGLEFTLVEPPLRSVLWQRTLSQEVLIWFSAVVRRPSLIVERIMTLHLLCIHLDIDRILSVEHFFEVLDLHCFMFDLFVCQELPGGSRRWPLWAIVDFALLPQELVRWLIHKVLVFL